MSFILDALRKSEHERQRQAGPGIADLRPAARSARFPVWAIALGALLLVNIVVVIVLVVRNNPVERRSEVAEPPATVAAAPAERAKETQAATPAPSRRASANLPAAVFSTESLNAPAGPPASEQQAGGDRANVRAERPEPVTEEPEILDPLPTLDEMAARGIALPELHLDIHVYVSRSAGRFVFINQRKYREGARLPEGPVVEQITRDGVVLSYGGSRFLMPRP